MNLELGFKVKKPPRKSKPKSKEKRNRDTLRWIVNKWKTGDLDLTKDSHRIPYKIAVSKGLIPKEEDNERKGSVTSGIN